MHEQNIIAPSSQSSDHPHTSKSRPGFFKRFVRIPLIVIAVIAVIGAGFVKFDTAAAANFTDDVLRPIFGTKFVVFFEGLFFNADDAATKAEYAFKKPDSPQFLATAGNLSAGQSFVLNSIPPNPAFTPLMGEGQWNAIPLTAFPNKEVMAYTFVRPDATRSFAIVSVVKMDMKSLTIGSVAGTVEPGGKIGNYGPGKVPKDIVQSGGLVAAFDGGFQYRDGQYGMIVGSKTYLPLKNGLGTVVGHSDGTVQIIDYEGQDLGSGVTFVRQNGPMLIDNTAITVTDPSDTQTWGRVIGTDMYTWRSGIGVTSDGSLLFAAGNNLSPQTLAQALQMAGAVNAIQLDINPNWVRFNIFNTIGDGKYDSVPLNKDMADGATSYLNGYQKDFFYIYKAGATLPTSATSTPGATAKPAIPVLTDPNAPTKTAQPTQSTQSNQPTQPTQSDMTLPTETTT